MWWLLSAGSAWALPIGVGVSGLFDFHGPAGPEALYGTANRGPGCGKATDGEKLEAGCDALPSSDANLPISLGVVAPLFVPVSPNAALRIEGRGSYTLGKARAVCAAKGGCDYVSGPNAPDIPAQGDGTYRAVNVHLPALTVSAGPDVRLTTGNGIAPHVAALVGVGLVGPWVDSDYFDETRGLSPTLSGAATIGLDTRPGFGGWFVDLSYAATRVPGAGVMAGQGPIALDPFLVNGVRLDVGLLFAD